jgi:hypothetical protein
MGSTYPITSILLFLFCSVAIVATHGQNAVAPTTERGYLDSADGLQAQISDIILVASSNDQASIRTALDSLGVPNSGNGSRLISTRALLHNFRWTMRGLSRPTNPTSCGS